MAIDTGIHNGIPDHNAVASDPTNTPNANTTGTSPAAAPDNTRRCSPGSNVTGGTNRPDTAPDRSANRSP